MEKKHWCRVCRKSFPSGRSLGGHMRSHVALASPPAEEEEEKGEKSRYGLRENPKKTWRCFSRESPEKICRECRKSFQSWKALFGHMRCHSRAAENEQEEHEGSWSIVLSENEVAAPTKRRQTRRAGASAGSSSSVSEKDEQEEVALTLMMLSRDRWGVPESSEKSSAVGGELVSVVSDELGVEERGKNLILEFELRKPPRFYLSCADDEESEEESKKKARLEQWDSKKIGSLDDFNAKFKCTTCNKSFHSYQALGGHRASHRRNPGGCLDTEASGDRTVAMEIKAHECLICGKCFPSGQALGGHKRSHMVPNTHETTPIPPQQNLAAVVPKFIDLNLPAPVEEEPKFRAWWKYEAMVGV